MGKTLKISLLYIFFSIFSIIISIFFISSVSASSLRINEVELNPSGTDAGNEWVELYSEDEINLTGYKLVNNDGDEINLSGIIPNTNYFVYVFEKQWLDNSDEKVFLYNNSELIDETEVFQDSNDDSFAFSYCNNSNSWIFTNSTKSEENNCIINPENNDDNETNNSENQTNNSTNNSTQKTKTTKTETHNENTLSETNTLPTNSETQTISENKNEIINLNPQTIKTSENNPIDKSDNKNNYSNYLLLGFGVILLFLFLIKDRKKKTEFKD